MNILKTIDFISYIAQSALCAAWGIRSFLRAQKRKDSSLLFYLLSGFYACVFMSNIYYLLTWTVEDYPFLLSPGDLSWVGALAFLITIALGFTDGWPPGQRKAAGRYRVPALAAPAVCIAFNIAYIAIYPDLIFNYLLYAVPTVILSYFALWLFLTEHKDGALPGLQSYHLTVLVWIAVQLFYDLFSTLGWDYGYAVPFEICSWLLTLTTAGVYFAAKKGVDA